MVERRKPSLYPRDYKHSVVMSELSQIIPWGSLCRDVEYVRCK